MLALENFLAVKADKLGGVLVLSRNIERDKLKCGLERQLVGKCTCCSSRGSVPSARLVAFRSL